MNRAWLLAACLLLATACGEGAPGGAPAEVGGVPEAERFGGSAVVAVNADIEDLNPLTLSTTQAGQVARELLFITLLRHDERLELVPGLARTWEVGPDTSFLVFRLRDDVFWHDGRKTTAADVKFTYDRARDPRTAAANTALWSAYGEMEVVDSFTVRVAMQPHAEFLAAWAYFAPVPRHLLEGVPPEELRRHPFSTQLPVGNGPFRVQRRTPREGWTLAANPRFPGELGGRPYLDHLFVRVIPEATTAVTELLTGRVDYLVGLPPAERARVEADERTRAAAFQTPGYTHIIWNGRRPFFRDARVRRALTIAINRQAIIDGLLFGGADLGATTVSPMLWNYDAHAGAPLRHDAAEAARLLEAAGWRDRNGDGIREDSAGRPFRFVLSGNKAGLTGEDVMEKVQADLRRVGVAADLRLEEFNSLLARIQDPGSRQFDAVLNSRSTGFRIDDRDSFHCGRMNGRYQTAGFCDPRMDRLLDTLPRIIDRQAALPLWKEYQRLLVEQQPYAFLYHPHALVGVSRRLQNVRPDPRGALAGARGWWVLSAERATPGER
jgi:peptide/nickel transport system substrate-binding protein